MPEGGGGAGEEEETGEVVGELGVCWWGQMDGEEGGLFVELEIPVAGKGGFEFVVGVGLVFVPSSDCCGADDAPKEE